MKIAVVPGDGIGKEVLPVAYAVLQTVMPGAEYVPVDVGYERYRREGVAVAPEDLETIKGCDCVLFGAITTPPGKPYRSIILTLRNELGLYANIRPFRSCTISPRKVDFTIYRENTEDLYAGIEEISRDEARSVRLITRKASERIARAACSKAGIKRLTIIHKANVLKSDELFRDACIATAESMRIQYEEMLVDTAAYNLIRSPEMFDTIVTTNMFGDILSDEAAALIGSLGMSPSANVGDRYALFEPVHGSAPDIAGKNLANPSAIVLAGALMLRHLNEPAAAEKIERAVSSVLKEGKFVTRDFNPGSPVGTTEMGEEIIRNLA